MSDAPVTAPSNATGGPPVASSSPAGVYPKRWKALSVLVLPLLNAYSRFNERQADRYAFRSIPTVQPFVSAMNKLADQNLAEHSPAPWVEWLFHSHPAISRRVAAAQSWAEAAQTASNHHSA